ncbi:MAG: hypothetical protein IKN57_12815, partial [Parasporobacterium sp.]|nr:hypothetical protein [Parasporobacterium sp.]
MGDLWKDRIKEKLVRGWQTWRSESMLAHVHMPEAFGLSLGFKDYEYGRMISGALVGEEGEKARVFPGAHAYDSSYTALSLTWMGSRLDVETAV